MAGGNTLILLTLGAIALLLFLILYLRLHAFLALLLTSMALGLACGMQPAKVLKSIQAGFGEALGFIAVVIALGAIIGKFLEHSGGGRVLAEWMLRHSGRERAAWAVLGSAFLIGLPIFFEVGFIILVPIAWSLAKESGKSLLYFGLPMAAALTVTHAMVPPHPAPAAAAQLLGANLGRVILFGIALSVPMAISGGIFYALWIAKRLFIPVPAHASASARSEPGAAAPGVAVVVLLVTLPVLLIFAASVSETVGSRSSTIFGFLGHPFVALAVTTLIAIYLFGFRRGLDRNAVYRMATDSLAPVGTLLAIIGGGGAFVIDEMTYHGYEEYGSYGSYFVLEPGIDIEFNIVRFFRVALNVGYRYTSDLSLDYYSSPGTMEFSVPADAIRGFNAGLTMKFGKF